MKNVFFLNIQQHVRHSTIISHNAADPQTWEVEGNLKITTTGECFEDKQKLIFDPLCLHTERKCHQRKKRREKAERR